MALFGIIVSGRLVQTDFQQVTESQCLTTILDADNINHIVVFLTGVSPLPEGMAGMVYFSWPDPNAPPNWQLLGHISNQKPSAIFKVSNLKKLHEISDCLNINTFGQQNICHNAQIGISIEPAINIRDIPSPTTTSYLSFTQKMLESFINYVSSFSVTQSNMLPNPSETFVPLSTIQNWYQTFERRLQQNPNFWKSMKGRPRETWVKSVKKDLDQLNIRDWKSAAKDRIKCYYRQLL